MNDARSRRAASVYAFNEEDKIKMNRTPTMRNAVNARDNIPKLLIKGELSEKNYQELFVP